MALPQDGQNANGLTKVTEIPKGKELIFIDPTTNEGGLSPLGGPDNSDPQEFDIPDLRTGSGNMTLLAALNQLNSNSRLSDCPQ